MTPDQLSRLETLEQQMAEHYHNGVVGSQVDFGDIIGTLKVVTDAAKLTYLLTQMPKNISDQIFIDATAINTWKIYFYDSVGHVFKSVTIT